MAADGDHCIECLAHYHPESLPVEVARKAAWLPEWSQAKVSHFSRVFAACMAFKSEIFADTPKPAAGEENHSESDDEKDIPLFRRESDNAVVSHKVVAGRLNEEFPELSSEKAIDIIWNAAKAVPFLDVEIPSMEEVLEQARKIAKGDEIKPSEFTKAAEALIAPVLKGIQASMDIFGSDNPIHILETLKDLHRENASEHLRTVAVSFDVKRIESWGIVPQIKAMIPEKAAA